MEKTKKNVKKIKPHCFKGKVSKQGTLAEK